KSIGITITKSQTNAPVGLFNSNCLPVGSGARSNQGFTRLCEGENPINNNGDNDLATGTGVNPDGNALFNPGSPPPPFSNCLTPPPDQVNFCTEPQGNVLIFEENPGDGNPDDEVDNGKVTFDFNDRFVVRIQEIFAIDDIEATLEIVFRDGDTFSETLDVVGVENAVVSFGTGSPFSNNPLPIPDKNVDSFSIQLSNPSGTSTSSGAISGVVFSDFPELPEPSTYLGLGTLGLLMLARKKRTR
ncbi:MAG: PEP-CTERM sorting domain-containing protein, partial [Cyanobacteria bacterium P01_H01_bin.15]